MTEPDRTQPAPDDEPPADYRARDNDHLVEPMFAGLGVGDEEATEPEPRGFFARLARVLFGRRSG